MTIYRGSCHCGGLAVEFDTAVPAGETEVRACQCSFCRMHGALVVSDPEGTVSFAEKTLGTMRRYTFGLNTADFLLCGNCGAYMGAAMRDGRGQYGIVNIRVLANRAEFTLPPRPADYDDESIADRLARRRARWTPLAAMLPGA